MKIKYLAHSSFLITSQSGIKIVTDPYYTGNGLNYLPINESADIVTISHGHRDHNNIGAVKGNPTILKEAGQKNIKGIEIKGIPVYHDDSRGANRGNNIIFCFKIDSMSICHMGDLGHQLTKQQLKEIGPVDILFIPVGGFFTIDARDANAVARSISSRVVIPMHFKTAKSDYSIQPVDDFIKENRDTQKTGPNETEFTKETLPEKLTIIVLQPSLI